MGYTEKTATGRWKGCYRAPDGRERSKTFDRKTDADAFWQTAEADKLRGQWIDPRLGRQTFGAYAAAWQEAQVHDEATADLVERALRLHMLPTFRARQMAAIRPSEVQAWVKGRSAVLAPSTLRVTYSWFAAIFNAAVIDGFLLRSPCRGIKLPAEEKVEVVPLTTEQVVSLVAVMPQRYQALTVVGASTGLRQGEVFGLTVPHVDFLRRQVRVVQQTKRLTPRPPFLAPPKTPTSVRTVPLPDVALDACADHLRRWPASTGMRAVSGTDELLVFTTGAGGPLTRATFHQTWQKAVRAAGLPAGIGFHDLRHYYASLLIASGASVKTVQARLGHKSALETLDTYGHLWPDSEDQTRRAVDAALGSLAASPRPGERSQAL